MVHLCINNNLKAGWLCGNLLDCQSLIIEFNSSLRLSHCDLCWTAVSTICKSLLCWLPVNEALSSPKMMINSIIHGSIVSN